MDDVVRAMEAAREARAHMDARGAWERTLPEGAQVYPAPATFEWAWRRVTTGDNEGQKAEGAMLTVVTPVGVQVLIFHADVLEQFAKGAYGMLAALRGEAPEHRPE